MDPGRGVICGAMRRVKRRRRRQKQRKRDIIETYINDTRVGKKKKKETQRVICVDVRLRGKKDRTHGIFSKKDRKKIKLLQFQTIPLINMPSRR
jgi:hypothetical protein